VDVSTKTDMDTNGGRRTHKRWPEALKREIVAASLAPGSSVSVVARQYDVNANQVFGWRQRYGAPIEAAPPPAPPAPRPRLVPVTIGLESENVALPPPGSRVGDMITIEIAGTYLVRVGANFDDRALCRVLDCLGRAGGAREKGR
jgi:transposase